MSEPCAAPEPAPCEDLPFSRARRLAIEELLLAHLPSEGRYTGRLLAALRAAVLAPGRRVRPALVFAAAEALGSSPHRVERLACAVEYVHTACMVLDDLPEFADRRHRRGRPCLHITHDVATAVLAAEALLMLAFGEVARTVSENGVGADGAAQIVSLFAETIGVAGMIGGEFADLHLRRAEGSVDPCETASYQKVAGLFLFGCRAPALVLGSPPDCAKRLTAFGRRLGRAYHILTALEAGPPAPPVEPGTQDVQAVQGVEEGGDAHGARGWPGDALDRVGRELQAAAATLAGWGTDADGLRAIVSYVTAREGTLALANGRRSR